MFPSLEQKLARYVELEQQLLDPEILSNVEKMLAIQKEMGGLSRIAVAVRKYHSLEGDIEAAQMMVDEETDADSKAAAARTAAELMRRAGARPLCPPRGFSFARAEKGLTLEAFARDVMTGGPSIFRRALIDASAQRLLETRGSEGWFGSELRL